MHMFFSVSDRTGIRFRNVPQPHHERKEQTNKDLLALPEKGKF